MPVPPEHQIAAIVKKLRRNCELGLVSEPFDVALLLRIYDRVLQQLADLAKYRTTD